jgi:hypothetical protein
MTYQFARIDLSKTNYEPTVKWAVLTYPNIDQLNSIYRAYCRHKRFASVMPIFDSRYTDPMTDVIGYYDENRLAAFSLIKKYDNKNALCDQFA